MGEHDASSTLGVAGRTKNGDVELAYERTEVDGDPLLLIAGHGAAMNFWHQKIREQLTAQGFQIAAFDNRDAGKSSRMSAAGPSRPRNIRRRPQDAPYRLEEMADDASAVLDALEWPTAHVVGHSLGGMVAQMLAIRYPARVRSLTTISSASIVRPSRTRMWTFLRLAAANPADFLGRPARDTAEAGDRVLRIQRIIGSPAFDADEGHLRAIATANLTQGSDPAAMSRQECAAWASGDLRPALSKLDLPTLVVHGSRDPLVPPEGGKETAAAIRGSDHVVIAGMGHDLPTAISPDLARRIRALANSAHR